MRAISYVVIALTVSGCGARYHSPPGIVPEAGVEFRNALGEQRWCAAPNVPAQAYGLPNLGSFGGLLGNSASMRRVSYDTCEADLRADGYALVTETPMPADQLAALRAQQAADATADTERRNRMR